MQTLLFAILPVFTCFVAYAFNVFLASLIVASRSEIFAICVFNSRFNLCSATKSAVICFVSLSDFSFEIRVSA